jgi:hypothetical protein
VTGVRAERSRSTLLPPLAWAIVWLAAGRKMSSVILHACRRHAIVVTDCPKLSARPNASYGYDYCIGYAPDALIGDRSVHQRVAGERVVTVVGH